MSITRLVGGISPGVGSDPRTFPAIFNSAADLIEANEAGIVTNGSAIAALDSRVTGLVLDDLSDVDASSPSLGDLLVYDGTEWVSGSSPGGKILEVKHAIFTGVQDTSLALGANVAVTNLSITHEVANPANKLIITAFLGAAANSQGFGNAPIAIHDGTGFIGVAASPGSRIAVGAGGYFSSNAANFLISNPSLCFVHTPGSGSKTYQVRVINVGDGTRTIYVNRSEIDTNSSGFTRTVSALVIQEVSV
jgi:hypothetical protein